jgi:hypothetical protein
MHEVLHIIGLCPDNLSHPDILDFILMNYFPDAWYFQKNSLSLIKLKIRYLWDRLVTITGMLQIGLRK